MERLGKHFFKKMQIKTLIFQHYTIYFVLILFLFLNSCYGSVKNCKISPDYKNIVESATENKDNLSGNEYWEYVRNKGWCQALRLVLEKDTHPISQNPLEEE